MYYRILLPAALVLCLIHGCAHTSRKGKDVPGVQSPDAVAVCMETGSGIPKEAMAVIRAYPDQGLTYRDNKLVFADGTSIVFDDGVEKDFATKLDRSDVEDMFSLAYDRDGQPDYLADAGRSRCEPLFKKMYGKSAKQVRKNLVHVAWFGQTVPFTRVNGANRQLEKVAAEIAYANRIPLEIVGVFEKYGFVWGGGGTILTRCILNTGPKSIRFRDLRGFTCKGSNKSEH